MPFLPESRLLLRCAAADPAPDGDTEIVSLTRRADPSHLLDSATWHGVVPLLAALFRRAPTGAIPSLLQDPIQTSAALIAHRNLRLAADLVRTMRLFEREGIAAVAYKGPLLALDLYGDLALRSFLDLDLLIAPGDIEPAARLLAAAGYHRGEPSRRSARWQRGLGQAAFYRDDGCQVDLHWSVLPAYLMTESSSESPLAGAVTTMSFGGMSMPTLSPHALLLELSLHGTKHLWERLKWICDIARFVRKHGGMDWSRMLNESRAAGTERMILVGLWLGRELLGAKLPAAASRRLSEERTAVASLGRDVCARLFEMSGPSGKAWEAWRFNLRARPRLGDRARCVLNLVSMLEGQDWGDAARRIARGQGL
jgi:hypothetical protein